MIPADLELGMPVFFRGIVFLPVVRQVLVRTPDSQWGAVSPVALLIVDGGRTGLALLDDDISQDDIIFFLRDWGIFV